MSRSRQDFRCDFGFSNFSNNLFVLNQPTQAMNEVMMQDQKGSRFRMADDTKNKKNTLRCSFAPNFFNNPYQRLLKNGLKDHHVDVAIRNTVSEIANDHVSGQASVDVVHLHWLPTLKRMPSSLVSAVRLILSLRKLKRNGVALVWTAHNLIPHESVFPKCDALLASTVARMVDRIIVHTEAAGREVVQSCGSFVRLKKRTIPHGNYLTVYRKQESEISVRKQLGLAADDFVFLFIGAIRPHKGVSEMIEAFKEAKVDARMVIAGNVSDKDFERRLKEEEIKTPGFKIIPGFVADDLMPVFHEAADIVVFPHQRALTSGALVLAMSFGKACLVPSLGTLTEMVGEEGAIHYLPGDISAMAAGMRKAFQERSGLQAMGARNLAKARQWDWCGVAGKTREVYEEAMFLRHSRGNA